MLVSHRNPSQPSAHWHSYESVATDDPLTPDSTQVLSCKHGIDAHSSISSVQSVPLKPTLQTQLYMPSLTRSFVRDSAHVPFDMVQILPFDMLWLHGLDAHSSISSAQLKLPRPVGHVQLKEANASVHTPPYKHGLVAHSSMSFAQFSPSQPARQLQRYEFIAILASVADSAQLAPF